MLAGFFQALEARPVVETILKEVVGINAPRIALARTDHERVDTSFNEIGNTVGFFGGGYLTLSALHALLPNQPMDKLKLSHKSKQAFEKALQRNLWHQSGAAWGVSSLLFAFMWALPFMRNHLTASRTGQTQFTQIIGAKKHQGQHNRDAVEDEKAKNRWWAKTIMSLGVAGAISGILLGRWGASKGFALTAFEHYMEKLKSPHRGLKNVLDRFLGAIRFKDGKFKNFNSVHGMFFWGLPAYIGWVQAARDKYERVEWIIKTANFFTWFYGLPAVIKTAFTKRFAPEVKAQMTQLNRSSVNWAVMTAVEQKKRLSPEQFLQAKRLWTRQNVVSLLASIVLLGVSPMVLNRYLTSWRLRREGTHEATMPNTATQAATINTLPTDSYRGIQRTHDAFSGFIETQQGTHQRRQAALL